MKPGPKPQSATVHLLKGNPSKKPISQLLGELKPEVEIPTCPPVCWPEAKRHWKYLTGELYRYGLVSLLDRGELAFACQEWARWCWAEKKIAELNKADPAGEAGLIEKAPSGYRMHSVYLQISKASREGYRRAVDGFGLSPAARARVVTSDNYPFLPGMEPGDEEKKGGEQPAAKATLVSLAR